MLLECRSNYADEVARIHDDAALARGQRRRGDDTWQPIFSSTDATTAWCSSVSAEEDIREENDWDAAAIDSKNDAQTIAKVGTQTPPPLCLIHELSMRGGGEKN